MNVLEMKRLIVIPWPVLQTWYNCKLLYNELGQRKQTLKMSVKNDTLFH